MRQKPRLDYKGLTIVLSNGSRFDKLELLAGNGGHFFNNECLRPHLNKWQCDVRTREETQPLLPNTKAVLLMGEAAMKQWTGSENSLGEMRGAPTLINGIYHIATFLPQDAVDLKDYEGQLNTEASYENPHENNDGNDKTRHGNTARSNFKFWIRRDTERTIKILEAGGSLPERVEEARYNIYPPAEEVIDVLLTTKNEFLYFDMETDRERNMFCFAFGFSLDNVYAVPLLTTEYRPTYTKIPAILRALAVSISRNTLVAHNGANFDFPVLAHRYRIPIGPKLWDTMIAQHRIYPEVEKSLGHCTSLWTWEPFHKDEGDFSYTNMEKAYKLWSYCGKDVSTMMRIHKAQEKFASGIIGMCASIQQAMDSIRPYIIATLTGIHFKEEIRSEHIKENDRLMIQYIRIIDILIGKKNVLLPSSNKQMCEFFHNTLGYPVVLRSKTTQLPSLAKKALFKLKLKHSNPLIDICIAFRRVQHETGMLKWTPWKT